MTAKEWLDIIKQATDYNPEMTALIEKYGELLLEEQTNKSKWVDVDIEPELNQWCLINIGMQHPLIACYKGMGNWLGSDPDFWTAKEDVTHWQPLPDKPTKTTV